MLSLNQFARVIGCTQMTAATWYAPFTRAMDEFGIDTETRVAAFLAQVGHESGSLGRVEENLNYTAQRLREVWPKRYPTLESASYYAHSPERLANHTYAHRNGNGTYESGDGWKYRGRGPIQITGRANYAKCGRALSLPLLDQPDLLMDPRHGARSAAWYWADRGCSPVADSCDHEELCKRINGGKHGLADRIARYENAMKVLA